jgi:hypothetical protein
MPSRSSARKLALERSGRPRHGPPTGTTTVSAAPSVGGLIRAAQTAGQDICSVRDAIGIPIPEDRSPFSAGVGAPGSDSTIAAPCGACGRRRARGDATIVPGTSNPAPSRASARSAALCPRRCRGRRPDPRPAGISGRAATQSSIPAFTVPRAGAAALRPGLRSFGETARQGCRAHRGFGSLRSWLVGEKDPLSWPGRVEQICHLADV